MHERRGAKLPGYKFVKHLRNSTEFSKKIVNPSEILTLPQSIEQVFLSIYINLKKLC